MKSLTYLWNIYKKFVSTSVQVESSFRTSYVLIILMDLFFFVSSLTSVNIIYDHVSTVGPWNREQLLFFTSFMLCLDSLHMMIFSQNFWHFSYIINTGQMDFVILKPASTIFSVFFRNFRSSSLFTLPFILAYLIHTGIKIQLGPLDWLMLPLYFALALTLLVLIEFVLSTSMFWLTEGNGINFLRMQLQQLSRWPAFIYSGLYRKVFITFIPVLLVGSAPVEFIYNKSQWHYFLLMPVMIIIFCGLLKIVWSFGLRRYDSASS